MPTEARLLPKSQTSYADENCGAWAIKKDGFFTPFVRFRESTVHLWAGKKGN
jgi:hypothetical protein